MEDDNFQRKVDKESPKINEESNKFHTSPIQQAALKRSRVYVLHASITKKFHGYLYGNGILGEAFTSYVAFFLL